VRNQPKHLLVSFIRTSKILKFTTWAELIHFTCNWPPITDIADNNTISLLFILKQEFIRSELDFILSFFATHAFNEVLLLEYSIQYKIYL